MASILVVDDDPVQLRLTGALLDRLGHDAIGVESGEAALAALSDSAGEAIDAVLLDLSMPGMDGMAVLEAMTHGGHRQQVIVQTAKGGIDTVVGAMRAGAFDFVVKPASPERMARAIEAALKVGRRRTAADGEAADRGSSAAALPRGLVSRSPAMERVMGLVRKAATSNIPVLIEGESGTGKERIARAIGEAGARRRKAFVTVNCGAIPDNLVESILFGHEKGSFTGASERQIGKFVEADGGTLFLDEIGDLPLDAQVKLLRAIQEGEVDPVGARRTRTVDIRLVTATHRDLLDHVRTGRFREDLFYRVSVFPIRMPPLRDRLEDLPLLVEAFIERFAAQEGKRHLRRIDADALALLSRYDWPGNIRQLENAIFRAVVLCDGASIGIHLFPQIAAMMDDADLHPPRAMATERQAGTAASRRMALPDTPPLAPSIPPAPVSDARSALHSAANSTSLSARMEESARFQRSLHGDGGDEAPMAQAAGNPPEPAIPFGYLRVIDEDGQMRPIEQIEAEMIEMAIGHYSGRLTEVARRLGVGRSTLYRKLKEFGIEAGDGRAAS